MGASGVEDAWAPPGCSDVPAVFDPEAVEVAGGGSQAAAGTTFFLGCVFFAVLALGLLAGACLAGGWAEEGFVASGSAWGGGVGSCDTGACADDCDWGVDATGPGSTNMREEIPKIRIAAARVMRGPGW